MIAQTQFQSLLDGALASAASCGNTTLITIDGPSGSGKTSLASQLQIALDATGQSCVVIHLDDHYNGWGDALGTSLTTLLSETVIPGLQSGQGFSLPRFDWLNSQMAGEIHYSPSKFLILEGVGSGQRITEPHRAVAIWIEVSEEIGLSRVLQRDGAGILEAMIQFQEDQREHFALESTKSRATHRFDGS